MNTMTWMTTSRRPRFVASCAAFAVALALAFAGEAQPVASKNKVVFQVSDADPMKWALVLRNVHNLQEALHDPGADIEVVAYGPGIGMLKSDSSAGSDVAETLKSGVKVVACQNTMKGQALTPSDMLPRIGYVPAGVAELVRKQQAGYAYLRP